MRIFHEGCPLGSENIGEGGNDPVAGQGKHRTKLGSTSYWGGKKIGVANAISGEKLFLNLRESRWSHVRPV